MFGGRKEMRDSAHTSQDYILESLSKSVQLIPKPMSRTVPVE